MNGESLRGARCTCPNRNTMVGNCPIHGDVARLAGTYVPGQKQAERVIELENARQALWDCFKYAGGDTDGDESPHMETRYLTALAVEIVRDLRESYDNATERRGPDA